MESSTYYCICVIILTHSISDCSCESLIFSLFSMF
uniref:Uncharacterized protein n=1 Tax=Rhizophora mucronata TaxID=61149 RepID=A0A2P2J7N5_RHIMU